MEEVADSGIAIILAPDARTEPREDADILFVKS